MADFSALKTAIQANIRTNGNEEITGAILQDILLSMVTTMGDGAINALAEALTVEVAARQNAVSGEATTRAEADSQLSGRINAEAQTRWEADTQLANSITAITTRLNEGYVYAGIATPSTNPGTPAGKVFYIALQAGTYTNFSSLSVAQGITILKYNGTAWSQERLVGIDNIPQKNGSNMVTSGGVFANIGAFDISEYHKSGSTLATYADLTAALAALPSDFQKGGMSIKFVQSSDNKYVQFRCMSDEFTTDVTQWQGAVDVPVNGDKNLMTSGGVANICKFSFLDGYVTVAPGNVVDTSKLQAPTALANYSTFVLRVSKGDKITISGKGGSDVRLYYICDEEKTLKRVADAAAKVTNYEITIGDGEAYFAYNSLIESPVGTYITRFVGITAIADQLTRRIDLLENSMNEKLISTTILTSDIEWTQGRFIKNDGNITATSATNKVGEINISGFSKLDFNFSVRAGSNYTKYGWMITDKSGNILSHSSEYGTVGDTTVSTSVPLGAYKLYISWNTSLTTSCSCSATKELLDQVNILEEEINGIINNDDYSVETQNLSDYLKARYDNGNYSYTLIANTTNDYLPSPKVIKTTVVSGAVTRKLVVADNKRFNNSVEISLDLVSNEYQFINLEPNKTIYYKVYNDSTVTDSGSFKTIGSVRFLAISATSGNIANVRDIGGWQTDTGKHILYGKIIRSSELDDNGTALISSAGIAEMKRLGVKAEIDLRGDIVPQSVLGSDVEYIPAGVDLIFYRLNPYCIQQINERMPNFAYALRKTIECLKEEKGIVVHCSGGCDRTGAYIAFIQGICGVSENDINHDYEISNRDRSREYYNIYNDIEDRNSYDGDFRYAMEFIKGMVEYNGIIYTKCRHYVSSKITIDNTLLSRNGTAVVNDVKYCVWTDGGSTTYYTTDIYPDKNSLVYNSSGVVQTGKLISEYKYDYWFQVNGNGASSTPINNAELIASLDAAEKPTLKEQFHLLLGKIAGLTSAEMYELEMLLTS